MQCRQLREQGHWREDRAAQWRGPVIWMAELPSTKNSEYSDRMMSRLHVSFVPALSGVRALGGSLLAEEHALGVARLEFLSGAGVLSTEPQVAAASTAPIRARPKDDWCDTFRPLSPLWAVRSALREVTAGPIQQDTCMTITGEPQEISARHWTKYLKGAHLKEQMMNFSWFSPSLSFRTVLAPGLSAVSMVACASAATEPDFASSRYASHYATTCRHL